MGNLDVAEIRRHFPALADGTAYFDGPGGTQTPAAVGEAIARTLTQPLSNRGGNTLAERNADGVVHACRQAMADLLGADPAGIIIGRSMTSLTMDLARAMAREWGEGDEVVVTHLDHDGNVRPWVIAAERAGATVRWAPFDPATGELDPAEIAAVVSERTRVVAVTGASNLIGTMPDLPAIAEIVHAAGAWLCVDGVHHTAHSFVDMAAVGADFWACSPYKFLGPHCGVVAGRAELLEGLRPDKLVPASDRVPERFELGTLPYELMAGVTAAVDFLAAMVPGTGSRRERLGHSLTAVEEHEERLRGRLEAALLAMPGVTVWSRAQRRTPTLLVTFEGRDPLDISLALAARGINAPAGSFYAYEPARMLGLGDAGGLRLGLAPYVDDQDVDRVIAAITEALTPAGQS